MLSLVALTACSTLTSAQNTRNEDLFAAARTCENGSLTVIGISTDGVPQTRTVNSGGSEWPEFVKCYRQKSAPIWQAYCNKEPTGEKCPHK